MLTGEATAALMNLGTFTFAVLVAVGIGDQWLTWPGFAIAIVAALVVGVLIGRAFRAAAPADKQGMKL